LKGTYASPLTLAISFLDQRISLVACNALSRI